MLDKTKVHSTAIALIQSKLEGIQKDFDALQESLLSQTKSSAGDKHETGRAMAQLEQEKLSRRLSEMGKTMEGLRKIDPSDVPETIGFGSLVKTDRGYFFVSVGIGKVDLEAGSVFCITAGSPLGQKLLGKSSNETIQLNGPLRIEEIS
jgi:transcription elongation GreA/GreB family factor